MDEKDFVNWLGKEFQNLNQTPIVLNRFKASQELVNMAIRKLMGATSTERKRTLELMIASFQSGTLGDYQIPFDQRSEIDTIEAVLATIEAYLNERCCHQTSLNKIQDLWRRY